MGIALLVLVAWPVILTQRKAADRTKAIGNLKQINLALIDFDNDYGRFPDASTISSVKSATSTTLSLGTTTSNDYFRQLIAAGNKAESIFWARTATTTRKPDNNITGAHALEKGECSYAYVVGLSAIDEPAAPIAMAPMIPSTSSFDPKPYGDRAVILRVDGSVMPEIINPSGEVIIIGKNLFDPSQPYWKTKPDLKWPE
jgi:type II secretory pathway pseudopilin PulG